jgi:hypothetical protein
MFTRKRSYRKGNRLSLRHRGSSKPSHRSAEWHDAIIHRADAWFCLQRPRQAWRATQNRKQLRKMDTGRLIMPLQSTGLGREERRGVDAVSAGGGGLDGLDRVRTLKETAKLLGVSMATLRRRIADGAIKTVRLSQRRIGVLDSARQAFLQENAT